MRTVISFLIFSLGLLAQNTSSRVTPDCILTFSFQSAIPGVTIANAPQVASGGNSVGGCVYWVLTTDQFNTGIGTIQLEAAATSTVTGTSAGSFAIYPGTAAVSLFPAEFSTSTSYYPWIRVNCTAYTSGVIRGAVYGWRTLPPGGGGGGNSNQVCQSSASTLKTAPITFTGSTGPIQIVAGVMGQSITLCSVSVSTNTTTNLSLLYGTGVNCGTGTTYLTSTAGFNSVLAVALDQPIPVPASQAFCLNSSVVITAGGLVTYVQQ
jgi:hypothetical protein